MVRLDSTLISGLLGLASTVVAHPGHDVRAEAAERAAFLQRSSLQSRGLGNCENRLKARGIEDINVARREQKVQQLRAERGLDTDAHYLTARNVHGHVHKAGVADWTSWLEPKHLFGNGGSCIVQPEVTQGPYYIAGELVRHDVTEDQAGVPLFLDVQLIDVNTCEPLPRIYTDLWHCNATGVYSGVVAGGNGDSADESNSMNTFLRGVQPSDHHGVVHFETIFPGHYAGRAVHIHVATHPENGTKILPNGTIAGVYDSHSSHVGQLFFDMDLITEVEKTKPYSENTQTLVANEDDMILAQEADTTDPYVRYTMLGKDVSHGIFAWISIGINATRNDELSPAVFWTEDGPEENDDFGMGGGFPPMGSGFPSGFPTDFPSGFPTDFPMPTSTPSA